jgi:predicted secreted hydrolase
MKRIANIKIQIANCKLEAAPDSRPDSLLNSHLRSARCILQFALCNLHFAILLVSLFSALFFPLSARAADDWQQAVGPRTWQFPRDHGSHPEYRTEWWYFTGNLADDAGARFGYQLTFFRQGLRFRLPPKPNSWDVRDVYLGHFAITDVAKNQFQYADKISRSGPGLAAAGAETLDVRLLNWSAKMKGPDIFLLAREKGMELNLSLTPRKPLIFHGRNGLSQKGPNKGQASYYTSFTHLETRGTIKTPSQPSPVAVKGRSWFDQEFGSNQLTSEQTGWDWFSLYLSDGRDLMIYFLRLKNGSVEPASSGTLIEPNGKSRSVPLADIDISVLKHWKSPKSGGNYPSRWRVQIPSAQIDLTLEPYVGDQELSTEGSTGVVYWEGAITGQGTSKGQPVTCQGYVELTGYAGSLGGLF